MLKDNIEGGNHRSALKSEDREHFTKAVKSDVKLGYGFPLTIEGVLQLKDAEVYSLGLQSQQTINELGRLILKKRITHNLSHKRDERRSVNQRADISDMPEPLYGHTLTHFLHLVYHLQ